MVNLVLVPWLRRGSPGFSTVKLLFSIYDSVLGENTLRLRKGLVFHHTFKTVTVIRTHGGSFPGACLVVAPVVPVALRVVILL